MIFIGKEEKSLPYSAVLFENVKFSKKGIPYSKWIAPPLIKALLFQKFESLMNEFETSVAE